LDSPPLSGYWDGVHSGFTIFIQDGELTLECFPYGGEIPSDYRDHRVEINEIEFDDEDQSVGGKLKHWESPT
jgi:hypothetical protein